MRLYYSLIILTSLTLISCKAKKFEGLWTVDRIQARSDEVKPKGQWILFGKDHYQESGHGWQKHGVGTWTYKKKEITVLNSNGYIDEFKAFKVKFSKDGMEWDRMEDDRKIRVYFSKIEQTPMSNRDKMLGLWDLKTVLEDTENKTLAYDPRDKAYIIINWDNTYTFNRGPEGTTTGMYRVEADRNEIELVSNKSDCERETWNFEIKPDKLVLMSVNKDKELIMEFIRIDKLPED